MVNQAALSLCKIAKSSLEPLKDPSKAQAASNSTVLGALPALLQRVLSLSISSWRYS